MMQKISKSLLSTTYRLPTLLKWHVCVEVILGTYPNVDESLTGNGNFDGAEAPSSTNFLWLLLLQLLLLVGLRGQQYGGELKPVEAALRPARLTLKRPQPL